MAFISPSHASVRPEATISPFFTIALAFSRRLVAEKYLGLIFDVDRGTAADGHPVTWNA
jgi:hypothetical protein